MQVFVLSYDGEVCDVYSSYESAHKQLIQYIKEEYEYENHKDLLKNDIDNRFDDILSTCNIPTWNDIKSLFVIDRYGSCRSFSGYFSIHEYKLLD